MERLTTRAAFKRFRDMSLKRALFTLTLVNLLIATILSAAVFIGCTRIGESIAPSGVQ